MSSPHAMLENGEGAPSFRPLKLMTPYLWPAGRADLKARVIFSVVFLVLAKIATVSIPYFFGCAVDDLSGNRLAIAIAAPRLADRGLWHRPRHDAGLRPIARRHLCQGRTITPMRQVAVETFRHMHTLSLRFHLERKTGGLSRVIQRGTTGIDTLLSFAIF